MATDDPAPSSPVASSEGVATQRASSRTDLAFVDPDVLDPGLAVPGSIGDPAPRDAVVEDAWGELDEIPAIPVLELGPQTISNSVPMGSSGVYFVESADTSGRERTRTSGTVVIIWLPDGNVSGPSAPLHATSATMQYSARAAIAKIECAPSAL